MAEQTQTQVPVKQTGNELVMYASKVPDLAKHIQRLQTPLRAINPEARVVSNGSMYAGGLRDINFEDTVIQGSAYVRFLQVTPESTNESSQNESSLTDRLKGALFGRLKTGESKTVIDPGSVEYEGRTYNQQWRIETGHENLIYLHHGRTSVAPELMATLKTRMASRRNEIWTNEFLSALFAPLFESLVQAHAQIVEA